MRRERAAQGIPALPLTPEQTAELAKLLVKPPRAKKISLDLITNRVSPGVDPAAKVKAEFLAEIVAGKKKSPLTIRLPPSVCLAP
jgi:aconitate hydratase 2/2-methylisocitrate dehydratase